MTWAKLEKRNHPMERLGQLTARLIRLAVHRQLARGQAQLRAHGVPANFLDTYEKLAVAEKEKVNKYPSLKIVERGTF